MRLPEPADLTSLVLRTDFSDNCAWETVQVAITGSQEYQSATFVSDPSFAGVDAAALVAADAAAEPDARVIYLFLADAVTMSDPEHLLLAIDLADEPGRTFRVPPGWYSDVSANLCIANMDFWEFADAVDNSGTYRGFDGE